ncbi:MAG: hypothetical protein GY807_10510 [Gammaproteobacteria bacterium]|nr:hypothetical protein [Gammaproteobacteria bacterium]
MNRFLLYRDQPKFTAEVFLFWLILFSASATIAAEVNIDIDFDDRNRDLSMFWNGSGLNRDTADYNAGVQRQNMLLIGSIPHQGSLYMRPHDLLELVTATGLGTHNPLYDWSTLDDFLDVIVLSGQRLFFEMMGNPSGYFTDFLNDTQVSAWRQLVSDMVEHLEARYGRAEVRSWYFQTWNESNKRWRVPKGRNKFNNYYKATTEGLQDSDPKLQIGGPAINNLLKRGKLSSFMDRFLKRIVEKNLPLDYISYHVKGLPKAQVNAEISALDIILDKYPGFSDRLFFNEEADSENGWWRDFEHRATPWYAAFIARNINEHLTRIITGKGLNYRLANDNAFLRFKSTPSWNQRSHFAQFGDDEQQFALIKKPAHNVMTMLSLLGDKHFALDSSMLDDEINAIATARGAEQIAVLVYHYSDDTDRRNESKRIALNLSNLPFNAGKVAHYQIDQNHGDTFSQWQAMGSPQLPSDNEITKLRNAQELSLVENGLFNISENRLQREFDLAMPGVSLFLISKRPAAKPQKVTGLYAEHFNSISGNRDDILLKWDSNSRFIQSYEVLFSNSEAGLYSRVNEPDIISTAFIHQLKFPFGGGYYKIAAVDYWGRRGAATNPLHVTGDSSPSGPELVPIGNKTVSEGNLLSFDVNANNPGGRIASLNANLSGLPSSADFVDNSDGSGRFSWTPQVGDAVGSPYNVNFVAMDPDDPNLKDNEAIDITVTAVANTITREAENYDLNTTRGGHEWIPNATEGHSGTGAMRAMPNIRVKHDKNYAQNSPRLDYQINFSTPGTYHVWIRGIGRGGGSNSVHAGLNGAEIAGSATISIPPTRRQYLWSDGTHTIEVPTSGVHTINVWMREDGTVFDTMVLTTDSEFDPSGLST